MKRISIFLVILMIITGCSFFENDSSNDKERASKYQSYIEVIESNTQKDENPEFYNLNLVINKLDENKYRYDVILDNPTIAMYDVQILCIPYDVTGVLKTKEMCPSAGILEEEKYNLIPNQVDKEKGYPSGIIVSGISETPDVALEVLVVWSGYAKLAENRQFYSLSGTYSSETGYASNLKGF